MFSFFVGMLYFDEYGTYSKSILRPWALGFWIICNAVQFQRVRALWGEKANSTQSGWGSFGDFKSLSESV